MVKGFNWGLCLPHPPIPFLPYSPTLIILLVVVGCPYGTAVILPSSPRVWARASVLAPPAPLALVGWGRMGGCVGGRLLKGEV